jgi:hypothetical protein
MNSFESLYTKGIGISNGAQNHSYEDSEESLFDGDFDALICDARSTENMLEFAETYQKLRTINADAKIKMCKKLRNVTRGYTKYQDSIESYLNHEISMEEAQKEENSNNDKVEDKPENENSEKKAAWYIRLWEGIKNIFRAIWKWILERIQAIKAHFSKKENSVSNEEMEQLQNADPEAFSKFVSELNNMDFENKSEDGVIVLNNKIADNIINSIKSYEVICKKLNGVSAEISRSNDVKGEYFDHMNQILRGACTLVGAQNPPNISQFDKNSVNEFNKTLNNYAHEIEYSHDPVNYVKVFAGARIINDNKIKYIKVADKNDLREAEKPCRDIIEKLANSVNTMKSIQSSIESASNTIINRLKKAKNTSISSNGINEIKDDDENRDRKINIIKVYSCVTLLSKILCKISSIIQKIISKVLSSANSIVEVIENGKFNLKKKIGKLLGAAGDKIKGLKGKYDEASAKRKADKEAKQKAKDDAAAAKAQKEQEEKNRQNDYWNKVGEMAKETDEKNKRKAEKEKDEAFNNYNKKRNSDDIKNATSFDNDGSSWESFNF